MGKTTSTGLAGRHVDDHDRAGRRSRRRRRLRRTRRAAALAGLAALAASACGGGGDRNAATAPPPADEAPPADRAIAGGGEAPAGDVATTVPPGAPATDGSAPSGIPLGATFGRDLIVEMGLTMSTSNVQATLDEVRRLTQVNGGAVFRADVNIGEVLEDGSVTGGGTLEIRIPPAQLERLVEDLDGVARISNVRQDTEDVTDQLIDLEIRIRQARTGIAQIEVLYERATEFADLVEIEQELARRQVDLERLLAAQRGVESRVELSKLTVTIAYEPLGAEPAAADDSGSEGIGDAFRSGWDAFAGALFAIGFVLAVGAPFIAIGLAVLLAAWLVTRRRNGSPAAPAHASRAVGDQVDEDLVAASHED